MRRIFLFIVAFFCIASLHAQQKFDTVYMKNGDVSVGSITAVNDASVNFTYKGETLGYTFKTGDISKIIFSSGRIQNFSAPVSNTANTSVPNADVNHHNKVAVLPFGYINPNQETNTEMGYKVQNECYTYLSNKASAYNIQDPSTTNALLGKAGVSFENVRNFTNTELCNMLGVEYVVRGTITSNISSTSSSGSASYDQKNKSGSTDKNGNYTDKSSGNVYTSGSTQQNFQTSVLLEIYQDSGNKVFGQDRTSFWQTVDAYKATIQYLLKKSPIYGK